MSLFSDRSLWTMAHGIVLGGGALMMLFAALFGLYAMRAGDASSPGALRQSRALSALMALAAATLWLTVIVGTYVVFPPYRATPPAGTTDLSAYPRAAILANPETAWLHAFAMEEKEHAPWLAAMLATAAAFIMMRYGPRVLTDARLRNMTGVLLTISLALVAFASVLGVFVNKVAPLE
jgi:hypothetical protein